MSVIRRFSEKYNGYSEEESSYVYKGCIDENYIPLIEKINKRIYEKNYWFSCEFFPPRTPQAAVNLVSKFDKFASGKPLFCDITWHAAGDPLSDTPTSSILIANTMLNYCNIETMLHMICAQLTESQINDALKQAKNYGISNILALRGDLPRGVENWEQINGNFNYAIDLVRHIRKTYGDKFVICVAGYPSGHPEAESYAQDLLHLKEKIDAGGDFIITQLFFDSKTFLKFERNCREIGITCPIIPGIMPIQAYQSLKNIVSLSKLEVPTDILKVVESNRDNEEAICQYGIDLGVKLCKELLNSGKVYGLHFYTLNRENATIKILKQIGLWAENIPRILPFKKAANHGRMSEGIRPIFWSNRPSSYVYRTKHWGEFPSSRWAGAAVTAFQELEDPYLFYLRVRGSKEELLDMWERQLEYENDVWKVFYHHITQTPNANGFMVKSLPWHPNTELENETKIIQTELGRLNKQGILTINSQPCINGVESTDDVFGWGLPGGYIYQKAYLEFFIHRRHFESLIKVLNEYSPRVNYHIVQSEDGDVTNCDDVNAIAITWGVFPGSEIIQPTVVDPLAFKYWKLEAFDLWIKHWGILYEENSISRQVIKYMHDNYHLVNLVDNDYIKESCLFKLVQQVLDSDSSGQNSF